MKKLSPLQSRVLAELAWDARGTVSDVAKKLKVRPHTVRRAVAFLNHGLKLRPVLFTDPYRQGQIPCRVYFSTHCSDESSHKRLIDYLTGRPEIQWFSALLGYYQYGVSLRVPSFARLEEIFTELDRECRDVVSEKNISIVSSIEFFVPWLAHPGVGPRRSFSYRAGVDVFPLDEVDRNILNELRRCPTSSIQLIGKSARIAPSTVNYRLQKLIESGVVIGFGNSLDSRTVYLESHLLFISTKGFGPELLDQLSQMASRHPSVVWVGRTFGQWDFEMEVRVQSPAEVDDVIRRIYMIGKGAVTKVTAHTWGHNYIW